MIPTTATLTVTHDCPACEGRGYTRYLQCGFPGCCRNYTTEDDLRALEAGHAGPYYTVMPCGHGFGWLEDIHPCSECEGDKVITHHITLADLALTLLPLRGSYNPPPGADLDTWAGAVVAAMPDQALSVLMSAGAMLRRERGTA